MASQAIGRLAGRKRLGPGVALEDRLGHGRPVGVGIVAVVVFLLCAREGILPEGAADGGGICGLFRARAGSPGFFRADVPSPGFLRTIRLVVSCAGPVFVPGLGRGFPGVFLPREPAGSGFPSLPVAGALSSQAIRSSKGST